MTIIIATTHNKTSNPIIESRILRSTDFRKRMIISTLNWFFEFSFSPTVLANPRLAERTLGGHVHFTSALSVGREFRNGWTLALRTQHISNGGLHTRNPGLDLIGITVVKQSSR